MVKHNEGLGDFTEFYNKNSKLINKCISRFTEMAKQNGLDYDDLFSTATIGFIKAYEGFDISYNTKFSTYAYYKMEGEVKKNFRDGRSIKIPRNVYELIGTIRKQELYNFSATEIAIILETKIEDVELALNYKEISSLNYLINNNDEDTELIELIPNDNNEDFNNILYFNNLLDTIKECLTDKEFKMFKYYYIDELNQGKIGELFDLSQVQISRLLIKIKNKIADVLDIDINNYKNKKGDNTMVKNKGKYNVNEAIKLISETDKSYADIERETGVPYATVAYHGKKIRGKKKKSPENSAVTVRKMTSEEKARFKSEENPSNEKIITTNAKDDNVDKITRDLKPEPATLIDTKIIETPKHEVTIKPKDNVSTHSSRFSLSLSELDTDNIDLEITKVIQALKMLDVGRVNIDINSI